MVLSLFLVVWWNHLDLVYAAPVQVGDRVVLCDHVVSNTFDLPPITVLAPSGEPYVLVSGGSGFLSGGSGTINGNVSTAYYNSVTQSYSVPFDIYVSFYYIWGPSNLSFPTMPSEADCYSLLASNFGGGPVMISASDSFSVTGSTNSVSVTPVLDSYSFSAYGSDVPCGNYLGISSGYIYNLYGIANNYIRLRGRYDIRLSGTGVVDHTFTLTPKVTFNVSALYVTFYKSDSVDSSDLQDQTDDLTNGFDNSSGSQAADQLGQEVDEYLKQEDALYDQMQYEVPEIDLVSDAQGIMLASSFMQSLYVSNEFISKIVTFALSFGLILFIVGWLKKRGS